MMRSIVGWSLRFRMLVLGLAGAMLLLGLTQLPRVRVDTVPEFVPPIVEVQTEALGLSADEVEQLITVPLEADLLHGVAFLDEIHSESVPGLSSIVLVFEPGTDIFRARQVVAERMTQAHALPNVSTPPVMLQPLSSTSRVMMVSLSSQTRSLIDMSVLARWTIAPRLTGVPGVANVAIWGQRERQLQVLVDPDRLRDQRVLLPHIIETTGNALWVSQLSFIDASTPGTGGFIDTPNQRLGVRHVFPIETPEDLAEVPIAPEDTGGRIVRLGDVATVVEDHQPLIGDAIVDGGEGLMLVIEKFPGADTLSVTRDVEAALAAMRPGLGGIDIDTTVYRPATYLEEAIGNVGLALLGGFVLLGVVFLLFFRGWRPAVASLVAIPLSLAAAAIVLHLAGATINTVIVAGLVLAVGVLVDDAVTGAHAVANRLRHPVDGDAGRSRAAIILEATLDSRLPLLYATAILALALVPLLFVTGAAGAFLPPLVVTYGLAILASLLVALTVTPALALLLLPAGPAIGQDPPIVRRARAGYGRILSTLMSRSSRLFVGVAVVTVVAVAVAGVVAIPRLSEPVIPAFQDRDLLVRWEGPPGTSRVEMNRIIGRASNELRSLPGVRHVGAHVGRAISSDQVVNVNAGEIWVSLDGAADYAATLVAVQEVIDGYPGLRREIATYPAERIDRVLTGSDDDLVVRVYGQELPILRAKAEEIGQALSGIDGLEAVTVEQQVEEPALHIKVDLAAAERLSLKPGDIRRAAAAFLSGMQVGWLFEDQKVFEVVVWGTPDLRLNPTTVRDLQIQAPGNRYVRLGDVARVDIAPSPSVIRREGVFRRFDVGAKVVGRDLAAVTGDVSDRLASIEFPLEYRAEVRGLAAQRQDEMTRLALVIAAAIVGGLLLLQAAFVSWRLALLALVALPPALVGAALGAAVAGPTTVGVIGGFVSVLALSLRFTMTGIGHFQRLHRTADQPFGRDLVVQAARERLGPVMATAIGTGLAFLPALVLGDRAGLEIIRPMAVVILGGLVTTTLLNLFVLPTVYLSAGSRPAEDPASQLAEQPGMSPA